ncbi:heme ABC exporter ATP-binding protein CcmA [Plastoroseomonas hellenica]|uniref:heme ABC exporter ATP-binding protein CcmA n=1 Tax=Plastoroseomonas hellenica TaxID=2687306 RepID=UPI001BAB4E3F|nr:heme ABC exporter ATP-binding protein CcmA [Plastoroseomonas hellenica]MBR0646082.1 heme ABC exporter ATP-binding protein CcmA [Plastoroseomonas hellenica]
MLHAENLACLRGERVVFAGLSFALAPGEALLLTGANGAGKSTLLRLLAGLLRPAEGRVLWNGAADGDVPLRYLGHADALKPAFTAAENLGFAARLAGVPAVRVAAALAAMDLTPLALLPARVLSSGQKRRLALARLALDGPGAVPLWLLDEPTTGLDAASVERLGALFAAHRAAGGMVIAATHLPLPLDGARELRL